MEFLEGDDGSNRDDSVGLIEHLADEDQTHLSRRRVFVP